MPLDSLRSRTSPTATSKPLSEQPPTTVPSSPSATPRSTVKKRTSTTSQSKVKPPKAAQSPGSIYALSIDNHSDDERRAARVNELRAIGQHKYAARVDTCQLYGDNSTCKRRECLICAERKVNRHAARLTALVKRMSNPTIVLWDIRSVGLHDLKETLERFSSLRTILRRHKSFKTVLAGAGAVETLMVRAKNGYRYWRVHSHCVLDLPPSLDLAAAAAVWRTLTNNMGDLKLDTRPKVNKRKAWDAMKYWAKKDTWCPNPGTMPLDAYRILQAALPYRRLVIRWGAKRLS